MKRWIIHVDMDAFFASIEQRDHFDYRNKPVIVGGLSSRGVVSTASYEARKFGVHSAMPMSKARQLCPTGIFLASDHAKYAGVSKQIMDIFHRYSPVVEALSLDEAFLDVSGMEWLYTEAKDIAISIKQEIKYELGLTASAGVAGNKFLAKLASDLNKPDGLVVIQPDEAEKLLQNMLVQKIWGVGSGTAKELAALGIFTIKDLREADISNLVRRFGKSAYDWQSLAWGRDSRPVVPNQVPKSVGSEITFEADILNKEQVVGKLLAIAEHVGWRLRQMGKEGKKITLKVRFASFRTITRSMQLADATNFGEIIYKAACELWSSVSLTEGIRLIGISVSQLETSGQQVNLFDDGKLRVLSGTVDKLKAKYGNSIITKARLLDDE